VLSLFVYTGLLTFSRPSDVQGLNLIRLNPTNKLQHLHFVFEIHNEPRLIAFVADAHSFACTSFRSASREYESAVGMLDVH
jgi:hypothetical protein